MFCLFFDSKTSSIRSLNGSGRSNANLELKQLRNALGIADGTIGNIPTTSVHSVTVPGAAAGWVDCVERFGSGKVSLAQILAPAIRLAEEGFPVSEVSSFFVSRLVPKQVYMVDILFSGNAVRTLSKGLLQMDLRYLKLISMHLVDIEHRMLEKL